MSDETAPAPEVETPTTPAVEEAPAQPVEEDQTNDNVFMSVASDPEAVAQNNEAELVKSSENLSADDGKVYARITRPIYLTAYNTVLKSGKVVQISHEPQEFDKDSISELIENAASDGVLIEKVGK